MSPRLFRVGFAIVLAGGLALPACKKSKPTAADTPPPPGGIPVPGPGRGPQTPNLTGGDSSNVSSRLDSQTNLKNIGFAMHSMADANRNFPTGIADGTGKIGLSWRVAILPYIEQDTLYKQFKLDEPWDSEHNKKLIPKMPKIFTTPGGTATGQTYYRSFTGPDTVMPPPSGPVKKGQVVGGVGPVAIPDGSANTFLVAEAAEPVIWTKPDELPFEKGKPLPKLGGSVFRDGFNVLLCDGSTRFIKTGLNPTDLANAINRQDGMLVNLDN